MEQNSPPSQSTLDALKNEFSIQIAQVDSKESLQAFKAGYLGKKGSVTELLKSLGSLPIDERKIFGAQVNQLKMFIEAECEAKASHLEEDKKQSKILGQSIDITLPGRARPTGTLHPVTQMLEKVARIFQDIGFVVEEGPEIETDYYNFEALNIPSHHPARDMQDTFYALNMSRLLRTHTSPVQVHTMETQKPPIRMIAPGVVYRKDSDMTHTPMFHQVEGLVVDEGVQMSHLKGVVVYFFERLFEREVPTRFRPSFFPFTEPSAEVDIQCVMCEGRGQRENQPCRLCKSTGWLEVMGCGLVNPKVLEYGKIDSTKFSGFAFGMGIERLAMIYWGIPDIRLFFENDVRFLKQF